MDFDPARQYWHHFRNVHVKNCLGSIILNQSVILVEAGSEEPPELTTTLESNGFQVLRCRSIWDLEALGEEKDRLVVILDLDSALVTNRLLRDVKRKHSALQIIGISSRPFHPELREAIATHIYACLCKPVDPDDLIYLVKSIFCNATNSEGNPEQKGMEDPSFTAR